MIESKKHILDTTISRIDKYIESVNAKANFIIVFDTFILGTIIFQYSDIINLFTNTKIIVVIYFVLLLMIFIGVVLSLVFCFLAVKPYLQSGNSSEEYTSLLFFGSISNMQLNVYSQKINELDETKLIEDFCHQNHVLARGLSDKFNRIQQSFSCIFYLVLLPIVLTVLLRCLDCFSH